MSRYFFLSGYGSKVIAEHFAIMSSVLISHFSSLLIYILRNWKEPMVVVRSPFVCMGTLGFNMHASRNEFLGFSCTEQEVIVCTLSDSFSITIQAWPSSCWRWGLQLSFAYFIIFTELFMAVLLVVQCEKSQGEPWGTPLLTVGGCEILIPQYLAEYNS